MRLVSGSEAEIYLGLVVGVTLCVLATLVGLVVLVTILIDAWSKRYPYRHPPREDSGSK